MVHRAGLDTAVPPAPARLSLGEPGTTGAEIHIVVDFNSVQVFISTAPSRELLPPVLALLESALLAVRPDLGKSGNERPAAARPPPDVVGLYHRRCTTPSIDPTTSIEEDHERSARTPQRNDTAG
jgi:hypothetical protein